MEVFPLMSLRLFDACMGKIYAGDIVAMVGKLDGETPLAASNIRHRALWKRLQVIDEPIYKSLRFQLIPMLIKNMIIRRTEPALKPIDLFLLHDVIKFRTKIVTKD